MRQDRFLNGILLTIGVLVALAVGLFYFRQSRLAYGEETTPEGVVLNYALAVQRADTQRAYTYLVDAVGKPDYAQFRQTTSTLAEQIGNTGVEVDLAEVAGNEASLVLVTIRNPRSPFSNIERQSHVALLKRAGDTWKIVRMPYPYWGWDWYSGLKPESLPDAGSD
jgi:hypothetical protein